MVRFFMVESLHLGSSPRLDTDARVFPVFIYFSISGNNFIGMACPWQFRQSQDLPTQSLTGAYMDKIAYVCCS